MALINYVLAIIFILTTVQCSTDINISPNENIAQDLSVAKNVSVEPAARTGRIMTIFNKDPKLEAKRFGPPHDMIRSRSDRFPASVVPPALQKRYTNTYPRHPAAASHGPGAQILRRVQSNAPNGQLQHLPPNQFPRYEILKSSRYSATKSGLPQYPSGKGASPYRPQTHFGGDVAGTVTSFGSNIQHPNALTSGAAAPNHHYGQHFKPSPNFSGNVQVRPIAEQQQPKYAPLQHQQQQQFKYSDQREEQHNFPKQQLLQLREPYPFKPAQFSYHQQQPIKPLHQQEPLLQAKPNQQHVRFESAPERAALPLYSKSTPTHSYSVYEDEKQSEAKPVDSKNAQEYLKFMSSNGYFLPKIDPNYKKIDDERDQQHYRQQQKQQQHYPKSYDSDGSASTYQLHKQQYLQQQQKQQQPIKVSQLFFNDDPAPPASAAVVRTSYQAGQLNNNNNNNFVVNSDGQKVSKRIVSGPQTTYSTSTPRPTTNTPASASYNHLYFSSSRNRTPEPVRFEFTERDAITPATYTHSPNNNAQQRHSIAVGAADLVASGGSGYIARTTARTPTSDSQRTTTTTTTASYKYNDVKPVNEDDPEDGEDMQQAGTDFYGRVPVRPSLTATSSEPPSEQKDTEDYCERICSNIQDDDEEIVCGSDGFMYTSEAQMECYASCLHIDVTIQSKGSCSGS